MPPLSVDELREAAAEGREEAREERTHPSATPDDGTHDA